MLKHEQWPAVTLDLISALCSSQPHQCAQGGCLLLILIFAVYWWRHISVSWRKKNSDENERRALQKLSKIIHYNKENLFNLLFTEKILMIVFDYKPTLLQKPFQMLCLIGGQKQTQSSSISKYFEGNF